MDTRLRQLLMENRSFILSITFVLKVGKMDCRSLIPIKKLLAHMVSSSMVHSVLSTICIYCGWKSDLSVPYAESSVNAVAQKL